MERTDRWQHLVAGAFRLAEAEAPLKADTARAYLDGVLEVFDADVDPVDDWEGYAVRRMALALREAFAAAAPADGPRP
jgi:hypothetical protein